MIIRLGDTGSTVQPIHQALVEAGYTIDAAELDQQRYGDTTVDAIRDWQTHHIGPGGHVLNVDGVTGNDTSWSLAHPGAQQGEQRRFTSEAWRCDVSSIRESVREVVKLAIGEIGVVEIPDGSNRGPRVSIYQAPHDGEPWCADFVSWCYRASDPPAPFGVIRGARAMLRWGKEQGRVLSGEDPVAGDVFVSIHGPHTGHVGLVVGMLPDGRICTVEGNSANACRGLVSPPSRFTALIRPIPL